MNSSSSLRSIYPSWRALLIGGLVGAVVAGGLYKTILGRTFAVAVIQAGRLGGEQTQDIRVSPQLVIDRRGAPQLLLDKLQTPEFAKLIADELKDPELLDLLPARQYGGTGALAVRMVSDGTLVEIRVALSDPQKALTVAGEVAKLAVEQDRQMLAVVRDSYAKRIADLKKQEATQEAISGSITKALEQDASSSVLLAAASDSQSKVQSLSVAVWNIESATLPPAAQESAIFTAPTLARPIIRNIWLALLAGLIGGGAIGYAVGLSSRVAKRSVDEQV